jgi:uncharacterized protein (DUF488 family)
VRKEFRSSSGEESLNPIFTIGHSTHPIQTFLDLLQLHGVTALTDVRSAPYSRFNPQFNKAALAASLKSRSIQYVFLGRELGARSEDPSCYEMGRVQYSRLARTELFQSGLDRVLRGAREHRLALMCAEKEPLECHRTLLVARALAERGVAIQHILADGSLETQEAAMLRLLDAVGLPRVNLFRTREELIAEALALQGERIAYVDKRLVAEGEENL